MGKERLLYTSKLRVIKLAVEEFTFNNEETEEEELRVWAFQDEDESLRLIFESA